MDLSPDQFYFEDSPQVSPQEIELNRAIMESLRPTSPDMLYVSPPPEPTRPYVPVPVPTRPSAVTLPTVTRPTVAVPTLTLPTVAVTLPTVPRPTVAVPTLARPTVAVPTLPPPDRSRCLVPPRRPTVGSPVTPRIEMPVDDEAEEDMLMMAIALSIEAAEHAHNAMEYATPSPLEYATPSPMEYATPSPGTEARMIRQDQQREYQEALRTDREREASLMRVAEEARLAGAAAEKAARMVQEAREIERAKHEALKPPMLRYAVDVGPKEDIFTLRFRLYDGSVVNHSFHRSEPIDSLFQQLRFDLRELGELRLTMQPRKLVNCDSSTSIEDCGILDRSTIIVERA